MVAVIHLPSGSFHAANQQDDWSSQKTALRFQPMHQTYIFKDDGAHFLQRRHWMQARHRERLEPNQEVHGTLDIREVSLRFRCLVSCGWFKDVKHLRLCGLARSSLAQNCLDEGCHSRGDILLSSRHCCLIRRSGHNQSEGWGRAVAQPLSNLYVGCHALNPPECPWGLRDVAWSSIQCRHYRSSPSMPCYA